MELIDIALSLITLIIGIILVRLLGKYLNKIRENKAFKELIKESSYSEIIIWYSSYLIKGTAYIIISLIAISFLGFAPQILGLLAVIMTFSIIAVLLYSVKDVIPSLFAGAYIKRTKIIKKGDKISISGFKGEVSEVNLLTITVKDWKRSLIIIPNKVIMEQVIKKKNIKKT